MKKSISSISLSLLIISAYILTPFYTLNAQSQTSITRNQVEQRALNMINLTWTYSSSKNKNISSNYYSSVSSPKQFNNMSTAQVTGIPYNWGGLDSLDSNSYNAPWNNFLDAINKGAYAGNVNTDAGYGYIPGTAGVDCSGFVQASYNIKDYKLSTSTLFNKYFTKINLSDIKHMDILDKPGDHVVIFDKWGTFNGISGAFTYEATPDQTFGGIQGTKKYFISMKEINDGYIPGRYIYISEDAQSQTTTQPQTTSSIKPGIFAQVSNVSIEANLRSNPSTESTIIGSIPKNTIVYLIDSSSGWYKINYNGKIAWIWGNLIASIPSGKYVTVNNTLQVNIRSNSTTTSSIVGVLGQSQYAEVTDYSSDGSWYKIKINGIEGWSYSKYLNYIY